MSTPYRQHKEAELLDLRRRLEGDVQDDQRMLRGMMNSRGAWRTSPTFAMIEERVAAAQAEIAAVDDELAFRRAKSE